MVATAELMLLEKFLGLSKGNKYSAQGKRQDLNSYLEDKVYLTGYNFTLANILLYYGLHCFIVDLTFQEKEKYLTVSRWFCHIQHYPGIRQHLSSVVFIKNRLYTNSH
ncbi:Eukaryotic translation elongation factor 1 epsilon-1 [Manis javanica]|nr:Eukaryotic translation elongation factor 1 epsilon-1 [Manis javanica]